MLSNWMILEEQNKIENMVMIVLEEIQMAYWTSVFGDDDDKLKSTMMMMMMPASRTIWVTRKEKGCQEDMLECA